MLDAREWEASVKDAFYPTASSKGLFINGSRMGREGRAKGGVYSHIGNGGGGVIGEYCVWIYLLVPESF